MRYYDLPKNKMSDFLGKSRIACELWELSQNGGGGLHWHDYYTLDLIVEGRGIKFNSLGHIEVKKGYIHLVMPSDIHHIGNKEGCKMYSVRFSPEVLPQDLESLLSAPEKSAYLTDAELEVAKGMLGAMLTFGENEKICINMLESLLLVLNTKVGAKKAAPPENFKKVTDWLDVNFRDDPTLAQAAEVGSYSAGYFSHLFKKETGYTYSRYLTGKKLNYACAIMKKRDLTLTEIAISSGFSSFENFNRAFKSVLGETPKEYRKKLF